MGRRLCSIAKTETSELQESPGALWYLACCSSSHLPTQKKYKKRAHLSSGASNPSAKGFVPAVGAGMCWVAFQKFQAELASAGRDGH